MECYARCVSSSVSTRRRFHWPSGFVSLRIRAACPAGVQVYYNFIYKLYILEQLLAQPLDIHLHLHSMQTHLNLAVRYSLINICSSTNLVNLCACTSYNVNTRQLFQRSLQVCYLHVHTLMLSLKENRLVSIFHHDRLF